MVSNCQGYLKNHRLVECGMGSFSRQKGRSCVLPGSGNINSFQVEDSSVLGSKNNKREEDEAEALKHMPLFLPPSDQLTNTDNWTTE